MVRNGLRGRTQRYKCNDCGRRFDGGIRRDKTQVITDYVEGKQTLAQLAVKYGVNEKTIRRDLEGMRHVHKIAKHKDVTVQMDTTYWGRNFGLMVIRDALRGNVLWHKYVRHETIAQYVEGVNWLRSNGFRIYGAVIDGMKGLPQALKPVPVPPDAHRPQVSHARPRDRGVQEPAGAGERHDGDGQGEFHRGIQ